MFEKLKVAGSVAFMTASLGLFASTAHASLIYNEVPDAGHMFDTAQSVNASVDQIAGNLGASPVDFGDLILVPNVKRTLYSWRLR